MGSKAIEPRTIRNVTIIGDPGETTQVVHRLLRCFGDTNSGTVHWATGRVEHTIRVDELSSHAPIADLERSIRVADGVIAVVNAAVRSAPRLETMLRVADDHQVARLCLVNGLGRPGADFDRCVRTIADIRGAVPLTLQIPIGVGADFEGVLDLVPLWALEPMAVEIYGSHGKVAEQRYRPDAFPGSRAIPLEQLHHRIRHLTRIGDVVPVLCGAAPRSNDIAPLLDAIIRYLPSPLDVGQPEHALDY
ncbi:GTP-binding protein [Nocardia sp. KC 131]|uniref:GTP-binding protein n=1 Tax=Nocardia arseniciresistens TaxID=3392119 RepID=UPI00398EBD6F